MVDLWDSAYQHFFTPEQPVNIVAIGKNSDDFIDPLKENNIPLGSVFTVERFDDSQLDSVQATLGSTELDILHVGKFGFK